MPEKKEKKVITGKMQPETRRLHLVFKDFGGSAESFGDVIGVSRSQVFKLLQGDYSMTSRVARNICYKLGYNPEWVLLGTGAKKQGKEKPGKLITDLAELQTEIQIAQVRMDAMVARSKHYEQKIADLEAQISQLLPKKTV